MFILISWIITGTILGSVGVALIASAMAGDVPRGDDFQTPLLTLMATTAAGAVIGGVLASKVRKAVEDSRKLNQLAVIPLFIAVVFVIVVIRLT